MFKQLITLLAMGALTTACDQPDFSSISGEPEAGTGGTTGETSPPPEMPSSSGSSGTTSRPSNNPPPSPSGTSGGTSSSGGSNTSGTGGSSSGSGGTSSSPDVLNCTISLLGDQSFSNFLFSSFPDGRQQSDSTCTGQDAARECDLSMDHRLALDFWARTTGSSYTPGQQNGACVSSAQVLVSCNGEAMPFRVVTSGNGCHYRIDPEGTNLNVNDYDGDGVATSQDCDDTNPTLTADADCNGTGGSTSGNTKQVAFYALGADYTASFRQLIPVSGSAVNCEVVNTTDPANYNSSINAVRCIVNVDLTQEFAFNIQVGNQYAAAWTSGAGNCYPFFRIYAYNDNVTPMSKLDSSSISFGNPNTPMFVRARGNSCDVVLPATQ